MEFCKLILTFESVDKFLLCDHSNEIFSTVLSRSAVCFCAFSKRIFDLGHSGSERVKSFSPLLFFSFFLVFCFFPGRLQPLTHRLSFGSSRSPPQERGSRRKHLMFHLLCSIYLTATTCKAERSLHVYVQDFCPSISLRGYYNRFTLRVMVELEI